MELSPFLFTKHFTNELSVSCVFLMKKIPTVLYKSPSAHISQLLFPPFSINPTDAPPQSSILIMKPTTTNHRNFRHLYSQPNIQFISYQDLHLHLQTHHQTHHEAQQQQQQQDISHLLKPTSIPPRNDGKKQRHALYR